MIFLKSRLLAQLLVLVRTRHSSMYSGTGSPLATALAMAASLTGLGRLEAIFA